MVLQVYFQKPNNAALITNIKKLSIAIKPLLIYRIKIRDGDTYCEALANNGLCYIYTHQYDSSALNLNLALNTAFKLIPDDNRVISDIYYSYGVLFDYSNKPEKSKINFDKAIKCWMKQQKRY